MVSLVIVLTMRAARGRRLPWLCLGLGFLVLALTDLTYVRLTSEGVTGITGSPLALGWVLAFLLVALSPLAPETSSTRKDGRSYAAILELLPYVPVFMAVFFNRSRAINVNDPHPAGHRIGGFGFRHRAAGADRRRECEPDPRSRVKGGRTDGRT